VTAKTKIFREIGNFLSGLQVAGSSVKVVGDSIEFEFAHSYLINTAGDTSTTFVPFAVMEAAGNTVELARAVYRCSAGTPTIKIQKNGADATGFTGMSVSSTQGTTDPANVSVADKDEFTVVCTAGSWTGWLYVTLVFRRAFTL